MIFKSKEDLYRYINSSVDKNINLGIVTPDDSKEFVSKFPDRNVLDLSKIDFTKYINKNELLHCFVRRDARVYIAINPKIDIVCETIHRCLVNGDDVLMLLESIDSSKFKENVLAEFSKNNTVVDTREVEKYLKDTMKVIKLVNKKTDECELLFVPVGDIKYNNALNGMLLEATSWGEELTDSDFNFIADVFIKRDGCSHFRFFGEDYTGDKEDIDGYYHICGFDEYIKHFRSMVFVYQLVIDKLKDGFDKEYETPRYEEFKRNLNLLDGYKIEEDMIVDGESSLWYTVNNLISEKKDD